jgi:hypothetical protein
MNDASGREFLPIAKLIAIQRSARRILTEMTD